MKFLIVDDHPLFREGIALRLKQLEPAIEPVLAGSIAEALSLSATASDLGFIILDLGLPDADTYAGLERVRTAFPTVPIVILSAEEAPEIILECLDRGAMGFITKSSTSEVFQSALQLVVNGSVYIPPAALSALTSAQPKQHGDKLLGMLSQKELQVLSALIEGQANKTIARRMHIAEATVKFHVSNILKALKVNNRTQAVIAAARLGVKVPLRLGDAEPNAAKWARWDSRG